MSLYVGRDVCESTEQEREHQKGRQRSTSVRLRRLIRPHASRWRRILQLSSAQCDFLPLGSFSETAGRFVEQLSQTPAAVLLASGRRTETDQDLVRQL